MTLGDFGNTGNSGFGSSHSKTVDVPSRFRNRTKYTSGTATQTWSVDASADPPKRKEGPRFASRKVDAGDVVARDVPRAEDQSRPLKQCRPRPATALVDDQKIGGHASEQSPRRAGECFGRLGKKPIDSTSRITTLNVHSPGKESPQVSSARLSGKRSGDRSQYNNFRVGEGLPKETAPPPPSAKNCTMSVECRKSDPAFLHWPTN